MSSKASSVIKYILLLIISTLLLFFAFKNVNISHIFQQMMGARIWWLLASTAVSFVALIIRAYRWKLLINPLGYDPGLKNTACAVMVGYFANLAFPRLGEVTRCGSLSTSENLPFNKLLGTVVVERVVDVVSLLICIVLAAILEWDRLGNFLDENLASPFLIKLKQLFSSAVGVVILIALLVIMVWATITIVRHAKKHANSKWALLLRGFVKGLLSIKDMDRPWLFVFYSVLIWVLYYLSVYVCLFALPFTSRLGLRSALFLLVASGLGMSAPVQGGIGAYHLLVSRGLMLYGISRENSLAFATLLHSLQLIMVIVTGSLALLLLFLQRKRKPKAAMADA